MPKIEIIPFDFRKCVVPQGLVITDPPYNQGYAYNQYKDRMSETDYCELLSHIPVPCVIIHYPEETIKYPVDIPISIQRIHAFHFMRSYVLLRSIRFDHRDLNRGVCTG